MYVYFEHSPGSWLVGSYNPIGNWMVESEHGSRFDASCRAVVLNRSSIPTSGVNSPTTSELIEYINHLCGQTEHKRNLVRVLNVVKYLSNFYIYADQITEKEFLKVRSVGYKTWDFYLSTYIKFKTHLTRKSISEEIKRSNNYADMILREIL